MIVRELYTYPVKSLAGIQTDQASVLKTGLARDRQWMAIEPDGAFLTQRSCPQMALIHTRLEADRLVLSTFGMEEIEVPTPQLEHSERAIVEVWGDQVDAIVHNQQINAWLSDALGRPCKLVYFPPSEMRACDPDVAQAGDATLFADGFPLLLTNQASLDDLNRRLNKPVEMERFRPNIVVGGQVPYAEDRWRRIEINGLRLRVAQRCSRCSVPTVNPQTGMMEGPEPIRTLSEYRTAADGMVYFGINMIPETCGTLCVGQEATVLSKA